MVNPQCYVKMVSSRPERPFRNCSTLFVAVCSCLVFMKGDSASKTNIDMYYILSSCLHNITSVEEFGGRVEKSLTGKT